MSGLGEENGSEVECYVGSEAFILLARGICWGGGGRAAEPPLLKKFTDAYVSFALEFFPCKHLLPGVLMRRDGALFVTYSRPHLSLLPPWVIWMTVPEELRGLN